VSRRVGANGGHGSSAVRRHNLTLASSSCVLLCAAPKSRRACSRRCLRPQLGIPACAAEATRGNPTGPQALGGDRGGGGGDRATSFEDDDGASMDGSGVDGDADSRAFASARESWARISLPPNMRRVGGHASSFKCGSKLSVVVISFSLGGHNSLDGWCQDGDDDDDRCSDCAIAPLLVFANSNDISDSIPSERMSLYVAVASSCCSCCSVLPLLLVPFLRCLFSCDTDDDDDAVLFTNSPPTSSAFSVSLWYRPTLSHGEKATSAAGKLTTRRPPLAAAAAAAAGDGGGAGDADNEEEDRISIDRSWKIRLVRESTRCPPR